MTSDQFDLAAHDAAFTTVHVSVLSKLAEEQQSLCAEMLQLNISLQNANDQLRQTNEQLRQTNEKCDTIQATYEEALSGLQASSREVGELKKRVSSMHHVVKAFAIGSICIAAIICKTDFREVFLASTAARTLLVSRANEHDD
jgi:uncharacterized phage infection (PIP) family protein YhgE